MAPPLLSLLGVATSSPKAQLSKVMVMIGFLTLFGTLTATGSIPEPQQLGGKTASATFSFFTRSMIAISGELPSGCQSKYSSPPRP